MLRTGVMCNFTGNRGYGSYDSHPSFASQRLLQVIHIWAVAMKSRNSGPLVRIQDKVQEPDLLASPAELSTTSREGLGLQKCGSVRQPANPSVPQWPLLKADADLEFDFKP